MANNSLDSRCSGFVGCSEQQPKDRLSSLPDFLLYEILSLLSIKTAATTSVLSRHWRYHWIHITRISINYPSNITSYDARCHKFFTTMDRILSELSLLKLHTFRISLKSAFDDDLVILCQSRLQSWVPLICPRNPEHITIETYGSFVFPACIFETQSLVELKLDCGEQTTYKLPDDGIVKLPNLKKLDMMHLGDSNTHLMATLFKSCPLLEVLHLWLSLKENDLVHIAAPHLKSLVVCLWRTQDDNNKLLIDAPKLEYLRFTGEFALYHFVKTPTTLRIADIYLSLPSFDAAKDGLTSLFRGIYWVKSLVLFKTTLFALNSYSYIGDAPLSFFRKLMRAEMFDKLQKIMNVPRKVVVKRFRMIEITDS